MLSETELDIIVDTALQIIDSSVNSEELFHEACSLSKKVKLECDKSELLETSVESFLSVTCQDYQRRSRCGRKVDKPLPILAKEVVALSESCSQNGDPLQQQEILKLDNILMHLKSKTEDLWYNSSLFESLVTKHNLHLEIAWKLHKIGAMSMDVYMSCKLNEDQFFVDKFSQNLVAFSQGSSNSFIGRQKIISDLAEYLINQGFSEKKSTLKRSVKQILESVVRGIIELSVVADEIPFLALPTDFLSFQGSIPTEVLKKFSIHALSCILSCKADYTVSETLRSNTNWRSVQSYVTAAALYMQLFSSLDCEEVAGILLQSLDQLKINGALLFICLKTMHTSFKETSKVMNGHVKAKLSDGLDTSDHVKISTAFLLARQSAVIDSDGCLGYSEWFESTFGDLNRSPASTRPTFTCLVKFLSNLVPSESAEYLKVHIMKRPELPAKCRNLYNDYIALAKTRLDDLKVPLHDTWKSIYVSASRCDKGGINLKEVNQAAEDVDRAVGAFAETGKIPTAVIEASIFRKPYFISKFLPALLEPRHLPDVPDMKMKLIIEISNSGKIPTSMYKHFLDECQKFKMNLLAAGGTSL